MSVIAFACVLGGTFLGIFLRNRLPEHHLSAATKDVVRLGTGLIGTIAGLVLGLLIASANSTFQTQSTQVQQLTANIVLLDRTLAQYGPETDLARNLLRRGVASSDRQSRRLRVRGASNCVERDRRRRVRKCQELAQRVN
jgi:hypothetical protein